jgi:hypothetical protein
LPCRFVSTQKNLNDEAVAPGVHEETEEKDNVHSKTRRTVSIFQVKISKSFHWESTEWICNPTKCLEDQIQQECVKTITFLRFLRTTQIQCT